MSTPVGVCQCWLPDLGCHAGDDCKRTPLLDAVPFGVGTLTVRRWLCQPCRDAIAQEQARGIVRTSRSKTHWMSKGKPKA